MDLFHGVDASFARVVFCIMLTICVSCNVGKTMLQELLMLKEILLVFCMFVCLFLRSSIDPNIVGWGKSYKCFSGLFLIGRRDSCQLS